MKARARKRRRWWRILAALVLLAGVQVYRWGRPVGAEFRVTPGAAPGEWLIERDASPPESWRAFDTDGDGVIDRFLTPTSEWWRPTSASPPKRWLVICIDGAPLVTMQKLWDQGHFREFYRPSAAISVFPSDSETAITTALHAERVPGYEHLYFDRAANELRGGVPVTLTGRDIPYLRKLDYVAPGWHKVLHYPISAKSFRADLGRLVKHARASTRDVYMAHVSGGDALFHLLTPDEFEPLLIEFESVVRDLYLTARGEVGILLWSDHGNTLAVSRNAPLDELLEQRGWHLTDRLDAPRDVVVPAYGLVGFFVAYCRPEAIPQLGSDLVSLEGAELAIYRHTEPNAAVILGRDGSHAVLRWTADGSRYRYEPSRGDPLVLLPALEKLSAASQPDKDGWIADEALFAATVQAPYPDAAARIRGWATNHVKNPADIVVSLGRGYFHGKGIFQHLVTMQGTHGALDAPSTLGFAMGTQPLSPAVRLADLVRPE